MTDQQARAALTDYQNEKQHEVTAKNLKDGEAFLAANKHKEGIQVHPVTLPDGRTAELQYKILTEGTGEIPRSNDAVRVNYRGTLIDDTEFDSSARHGGQPSRFTVNRVVRGWTEALQMMKAGAKWQLFIPASLAYEERMMPTIPPGSTLVFELELLEIDRPKPLTSDIIRVPSAEEMKAGAKIEMIKAEDVEKMAASQTNQAPADKK
jgi:FKBP-type peptidyl-prolyl cis-trans isomerase